MSKQIAVRLPDELVAYIDGLVDGGTASSRAAAVTQALTRDRRRCIAARDATILARTEPDSDLDELAEHAARIPMPDLD